MIKRPIFLFGLVGVLTVVTGQMKFTRNVLYGDQSATHDESSRHVDHSAILCANHCVSSRTACTSFLYDKSTGLCVTARRPQELDVLFRSGKGDLYTSCDTRTGYRIYTRGNTKACLMMVRTKMNYTKAVDTCRATGGSVASTKTVEKLWLMKSVLTDTYTYLWVGIDDLAREGDYVWGDDGSRLTTGQRFTVYTPGEPNDGGFLSEDCTFVSAEIRFTGLLDVHCHLKAAFLCEMPMVV